MKTLIAVLQSPEAILLAFSRLNPQKIILLSNNELAKEYKETVGILKNSIGRIIEITEEKLQKEDLTSTVKEIVKIIDSNPKEDKFFLMMDKKNTLTGMLYASSIRSSKINRMFFVEDDLFHDLPIVSLKLKKSEHRILEKINNGSNSYSNLLKDLPLSTAMVYRSIESLKKQNYIEENEKKFQLTNAGKIARL